MSRLSCLRFQSAMSINAIVKIHRSLGRGAPNLRNISSSQYPGSSAFAFLPSHFQFSNLFVSQSGCFVSFIPACLIMYFVSCISSSASCLVDGMGSRDNTNSQTLTRSTQPWDSLGLPRQPQKIIKFQACLRGTKKHQIAPKKHETTCKLDTEFHRISTSV